MELKTGCISIHTNLLRVCQLYILSIWVILRRGMAYPRSNHLLLLEVAAKPWTLTMGHKLLAQTSYEAIATEAQWRFERDANVAHNGDANTRLQVWLESSGFILCRPGMSCSSCGDVDRRWTVTTAVVLRVPLLLERTPPRWKEAELQSQMWT